MPKDTHVVETSNANKIFDIPVTLEPGQVNTLSFAQDSISQMRELPQGQLEISFRDGSKVVVENFDELVNSAQSCGRDTLIQLSDNTIIYPEDLAAKLAKGPVSFGAPADANGLVLLDEPKAGQIVEKNIQSGQEYKFGFNLNDTISAAQAGQNLILTFKDGGVLVLKNYYTAMDSELPPAMTLADGSVIDSNALLTSCKLVEIPAIAETVKQAEAALNGKVVTAIEPAAGEADPAAAQEAVASAARKGAAKRGGDGAPDIEPAAGDEPTDVANIEPAAGDAGAQPSSSSRGYGFGSSIDPAALNGGNAVGPIGATALQYGANFLIGTLRPGTDTPAVDTVPIVLSGGAVVDETNLAPTTGVSGNANADFRENGPGAVTLNTTFVAGGSLAGGALTSHGVAVVTSLSGNTITGQANGVTVFTITIDPATGNYVFTQFQPLDHADGTDPNDLITLQFGVTATDADGDVAVGTITIGVCDDAPVAVDDGQSVGSGPFSVNGNVVTNDTVGSDGATVTAVVFNGVSYAVPAAGTVSVTGAYGTLVIAANGAYTYTSSNTAEGTDKFTYTLTDFDGDQDTAVLSVTVTDIDTTPSVTPSIGQVDETNLTPTSIGGSVSADFKDDGPGTFTLTTTTPGGSLAGGALTSHGVAVTTALSGNTITGTANGVTIFTITLDPATGAYTYTQFGALDHADGANPNDVITLQFGVNATDADGDATPTTITISILDDAPVAANDSGTVNPATLTANGNVLTNDNAGHDGGATVTSVSFNGVSYAVPAVGTVSVTGAYGTLVIGANGSFTYTSSNTAEGTDQFSYTMRDYDGDTSTAKLNLTVEDIDTCPVVQPATNSVDESFIGSQVALGTVFANFGDDGPGTFSLNNGFISGGSKTGGNLTSDGFPVSVSHTGTTYTGTANGVTVFTLVLDPVTGGYTFTQFKPLDHADGTNPNDVISLQFGVTATDADGDATPTTITINVADDAPSAANDSATVAPGTFSVNGNVTTNDSVGNDKPGYVVTKVTFGGTTVDVPASGSVTINGTHGTLVIDKTGAYTYTSFNTSAGVDQFTYQIRDFDGDTATAKLTINVADIDTCPTINNAFNSVDETALDDSGTQTVTGNLVVDYKADGPGTVTATGQSGHSQAIGPAGNLTSHGSLVTITLSGNTYTGKSADGRTVFTMEIGSDGKYTFKLLDELDHADKTNPNDAISLTFGVVATDTDGDTATAKIEIKVYDDGPVAVNDTNSVPTAPGSVTGNVLSNDDAGADEPAPVKQISFNGTTVDVPTTGTVTINGAHGTLTIGANGAYTYTATSVGSDVFTYKIVDFDGDPATATLTITVNDIDTCPTVENAWNKVDETALDDSGTQTVNGTLTVDYKADGPGTTAGNGSFNSTGSKTGGNLTSLGSAVTVTLAGDTYTGKSADGRTIFTLQVKSDGTYTFKLLDQLDHADKANPDDIINLNFGFKATDTDGDVANGTITIKVYDDGPVAVNDTNSVQSAPGTATGNVLTNDDAGADEPAPVKQISFNGTTIDVPATGTVTINGAHGTLTIGANGAYTYNATSVGADVFTYKIVDFDGDPSTATLTITVNDLDTCPTVQNDCKVVDETALDNSGTQTVNGTLTIDYKADGPGTASGNGAFSSTGSKTGGNLTSHGSAVTVTLAGDTYTGKSADGRTIFTLQVKADGTYTFKLIDQLDHADKTNPDDVIDLHFGFKATDTDGDAAHGTITIAVHDDGPVAVDDVNSVGSAPGVATGNILTNDDAGADEPATLKQVTFGSTTVDVPATGTVTIAGAHGTLTIAANGAYTYNATSAGSDVFTYKIVDFDGDPATAKLTLTVTDIDTCPIVHSECKVVDETNLDNSGTQVVNGTLSIDYQADGPGTASGTGVFMSTGSKTGGNLTSNGSAVTVAFAGDTYTGKSADGRTIFTLQIKADGTYTFKLIDQLDHADKTNPDDVIDLHFGFKATDTDGDTASSTITIEVHDDGPVAVNDVNTVDQAPGTVTGNILTNDDIGADEPGTLKTVTFGSTTVDVPATGTVTINGTHGTLTIGANGAYTYTGTQVGVDVFTYKIVDFDGDPATATLTITVNDLDTCPVVANASNKVDETNLDDSGTQTVNGTMTVDYKADGPGSTAGTGTFNSTGSKTAGNLTSFGSAVTVTFAAGVYTGKSADGRTIFTLEVKSDASYTFKLIDQLDHADKTNPDDIINLNFGFKATDTDGDAATGTITIAVHDDGPVAVNDTATLNQAPGSVSGNVLTNDDAGADEPGTVKQVTFGSTTVDVPASGTVTIAGAHGTLTIAANGAYTYTGASVGADQFTYKMVDFDGDPATAKLTVDVQDVDTCPVVTNASNKVDETNLDDSGTQTVNGTISVNYLADGPGTTSGTGAFTSTGSKTGGNLTSFGSAVTVTVAGNVYTGTSADGRTIFTLEVKSDATYTFKLIDQLDHADKTNPDDIINLNFGFKATDTDGDSANGTITIAVHDDGPVAVNDTATLNEAPGTVSGNVLSNDDAGADEPGTVKQITFGSTTLDVPASGTVTINGSHGTLTIAANGAYTYTGASVGADQFTYKMVDFDGDPATAKLTVTVEDCDETPTIKSVDVCVDETYLTGVGLSVTGTTQPNFFGDGPGTVKATGASTFVAGGSLLAGKLTSGGVAVVVTLDTATNTYVGKAGTDKVFDIKINNDGTFIFTQFANLDHGNPNNPNDELTLKFGVTAKDADGDVALGTITVTVMDDAPIARDDYMTVESCGCAEIGNVLLNDWIGHDYTTNAVKAVTYKGVVYDLTATGSVTVDGANGKLILNADGSFVYKPHAGGYGGADTFKYTIADFDGDQATANLLFNVQAQHDSSTSVSVSNSVSVNVDVSSTSTSESSSSSYSSASSESHTTSISTVSHDDVAQHYDGGVNDILVVLENTSMIAIKDFDPGEGDMIDLSSLVQDYDPVTDAINDFVFARSEGQDTVISVDPTGSGAQSQSYDVAVIKDVTGVHVEDVVSLTQHQQNQGGLGSV